MRALTLSELRPFPLSRKLRYAGSIRDLLPAKQRKLPIAFKSRAPNVQGKICSSASLVGTQNPYNDMFCSAGLMMTQIASFALGFANKKTVYVILKNLSIDMSPMCHLHAGLHCDVKHWFVRVTQLDEV